MSNVSVMGAVLLYDGDCAFCTRVARLAPALRLGAEMKPLQSVDLEALGVSPARAASEIPFVAHDGSVSYGHEAFANVIRTGPWPGRAAGRLALIWPISDAGRLFYRLVAQNRHRLPGATDSCRLPIT
jgi:predicted DCC family thiol-disulfide oxidoreductase YuxK